MLSQEGVLEEVEGFVYVNVSDDYIHALYPFIEGEGFDIPPFFEDSPPTSLPLFGTTLIGAHITAITPEEWETVSNFNDRGAKIPFTIKECQIVSSTPKEIFFIITVDCPKLKQVRKKYGLSSELPYPFHITIGYSLETPSGC